MGSLGGALGQVGQNIAAVPGNIYQRSGVGDVATGLQGLFGGGEPTVPAADFVGPPSPVNPPNFLQGFVRGLTGQDVGGAADVVPPGAQAAGGLGELLAMLNDIRQRSGQMAPMAPVAGGGGPVVRLLPGYQQAAAPSGGLVHNLIGAATYGILGGAIPSSGQV